MTTEALEQKARDEEANALSLSEHIDLYTEGTAALYTGPTLPGQILPPIFPPVWPPDPWSPRCCPTCGRPMEDWGPTLGGGSCSSDGPVPDYR